jgi:hydroxymethylpyrimidine/phosphomethylpyrimidine kinase
VRGIFPVDPAFVALQIDATVEDIPPDVVKTGMLAEEAVVTVVVEAAERHRFPALVVDPVMVATTGARLLADDAVSAVRERLLPIATLVTPNAPEAAVLLGRPVETPDDQEAAARALVRELGARAALVKGGDLEGEILIDAFCEAGAGGNPPRVHLFRDRRIETTSTHGSGCALASAIAAYLARGENLFAAVEKGRVWVRRGIETAPPLGSGRGPLDLFPRDRTSPLG